MLARLFGRLLRRSHLKTSLTTAMAGGESATRTEMSPVLLRLQHPMVPWPVISGLLSSVARGARG